MSVSSEVKRTLVKSPPELWSELSDAESLVRHLGDMSEIRITRIEPEHAVEWEATGVSGSVQLEPSGFGTKVTLSLTRDLPTPEPASEQEAQPTPAPEPAAEAEPVSEPEPIAQLEPEHVAEPCEEPESVTAPAPAPEPKPGFFARLFRRQRLSSPAVAEPIEREPVAVEPIEREPVAAEPTQEQELESVPAAEPEPGSEPVATTEPVEQLEPEPDPTPDVTADLAALEAEMAEQDEAMLTAMLDRLGAAHHRPFSRG